MDRKDLKREVHRKQPGVGGSNRLDASHEVDDLVANVLAGIVAKLLRRSAETPRLEAL